MAGWQKKLKPTMKNPYCLVFAGNHGISNRGVSAYPSEVTYQMVENFKKGGAAINQLCDLANIKLSVIPIDLDKPTRDFSEVKAMEKKEVFSAMQLGFDSVPSHCDLLVLGEMGISNTTSASAISCALFNEPVAHMTGIGTGLNKNQLSKKIEIIKSALKLHGKNFKDPISILSCYGGREIAAIAGSVISARLKSIPVLLDGFICTAAASSLILFDKMILDHCRISHLSSEQGHAIVLRNLKMEPILDLNLRLGEGSGAAIASLILRAALATHNGMSTFTDAKVTTKIV
jgi:nicotinate-nucleotide--dimethylbenzimidazole phosphoribosyltransferase